MLSILGGSFPIEISSTFVYVAVVLSLIVPVAFYVLRTIAIFKLARQAKLKTAFMAFFPCLWIYPLAMLSKEAKFIKGTVGKWAIAFVLVYTLANLINLSYEFLYYFPLAENYLMGREICLIGASIDASIIPTGFIEYLYNGSGILVSSAFVYPIEPILTVRIMNVLAIISRFTDILVIVIELVLFFNLFRKYWPQHFVLATMFSMFQLFPIFAFIIRNKKPMSYLEYLRTRYQNMHGPYGPQGPYGQYQNPYNQNGNPNGQGHYGGQNYYGNPYNQNQQNPFQDFENKNNRQPEEPFSDFFSNDKKEDK